MEKEGGLIVRYLIDNFIFDSEELLLYEHTLAEEECDKLASLCSANNCYNSILTDLEYARCHQKSFKNRPVIRAGIVPSYNCNLHCNYCSQSSDENSCFSLGIEDILVFLNDIIRKQVMTSLVMKESPTLNLYFTGGGEPTYDWNLFVQMIDVIEKKCQDNRIKLQLGMTTNGLLNHSQYEYIGNHFNSVLVSYDGCPEVQDKNRKSANGICVSGEIEAALAYFVRHNLRTVIRTTIWPEDFSRMTEMLDYISEHFAGLYSWDINPVTFAGRAAEIIESEKGSFAQANFVERFVNLLQYAKKRKSSLRITTPLLVHEPVNVNCGGGGYNTQGLWLFPDKKITTCIDSSDIVTVVGRIDGNSIHYYDHFSDPLLDMFIERYKSCRDCIAFKVCGGGCPIKHIRNQQSTSGTLKWECSMQIAYWKYVLQELLKNGEYFGWKLETPKSFVNSSSRVFQLVYLP